MWLLVGKLVHIPYPFDLVSPKFLLMASLSFLEKSSLIHPLTPGKLQKFMHFTLIISHIFPIGISQLEL